MVHAFISDRLQIVYLLLDMEHFQYRKPTSEPVPSQAQSPICCCNHYALVGDVYDLAAPALMSRISPSSTT
jgi:hypothetical protein